MDRINQRDPGKLSELMTEDHVFIDSLGQTMRGQETMRKGWQAYYAFCPDYWISHEDIFQNGAIVAVFGAAGGTISVNGKLAAENKCRRRRRGAPLSKTACSRSGVSMLTTSPCMTSWRNRPSLGQNSALHSPTC
jgi:hypothetical protein